MPSRSWRKAQGEAGAFDRVYAQYKLAPEVTRRRMYYETMEKVLARSDKTVVEQGGVVPYLPLSQAQAAARSHACPAGDGRRRSDGALSFRNPIVAGIAALLLAILRRRPSRSCRRRRQAVVYRLGPADPRRQPLPAAASRSGATGAGLIARVPFFDRIVYVDKRVLDLDLENAPVLSTDQQRLNVDAFARFRVVDPRLMLMTAGSEEGVANQLRPLFGSTAAQRAGQGQRQRAAARPSAAR